ncbi:HEAT repeat domain-containing protein [Archaeoglobus veneficus]|uniref:PBS lyase HEAT domain protein repeat-containing protein n=1 Tax=Archaeoglobus veneficus (strain DSM 11195 / SNP6) TaxID=693661 RepID=F2KNM2_ARCVS|nr:HEAT repeat domain-containing protein [Archaeoglobus veneficus]AEA46250.1 PBS lyase HEAT domain protein repeat-containing protein [Archaeoglobus veneficus SNP6]
MHTKICKDLQEYIESRRYREEWRKVVSYASELPRLMESEDCNVRKKAVYAMGKLTEEGYADFSALLQSALDDECEWVRGHAAEALGRLGIADERITELLKDGCPWVRHRAAEAAGRIAEVNPEFAKKTYKALIEKLKDRSSYVQYVAIEALRRCMKVLDESERREVEAALSSFSPEGSAESDPEASSRQQ